MKKKTIFFSVSLAFSTLSLSLSLIISPLVSVSLKYGMNCRSICLCVWFSLLFSFLHMCLWVNECDLVWIGDCSLLLKHTPSRALLFSFRFFRYNNIKITTNDDDKMRYVDESRSIFALFHFTLSSRFSDGTFIFTIFFFFKKGRNSKVVYFSIFQITPFWKVVADFSRKGTRIERTHLAQRKRGCGLGGGLKLVAAEVMDVFFRDFFVAIN